MATKNKQVRTASTPLKPTPIMQPRGTTSKPKSKGKRRM